jgi:polyhydroxyalkanoate synthase
VDVKRDDEITLSQICAKHKEDLLPVFHGSDTYKRMSFDDFSPDEKSYPHPLYLNIVQAALINVMQHAPDQAVQNMTKFFTGLKRFQSAEVQRNPAAFEEVEQHGCISIRYYGHKGKRAKVPVLFIPSLINNDAIFDLAPDRSFLRTLTAAGHPVYVLHFQNLVADDAAHSFDTFLIDRLVPALEKVYCHIQSWGGVPPVLMGYCMGGLLAAAATAVWGSDRASGYMMIATPWDFHTGKPSFTTLVQNWIPFISPVLYTQPVLSYYHLQSLFAMVDPSNAYQKYLRYADLENESGAAALFILTESWLQSGQDLPSSLAQEFIQKWYVLNDPGRGVWRVAGHDVRADVLAAQPSLIVVPMRDRLVEPQTASALSDRLAAMGADVTVLSPDLGHIGMMASARAKEQAWNQILEWLDHL